MRESSFTPSAFPSSASRGCGLRASLQLLVSVVVVVFVFLVVAGSARADFGVVGFDGSVVNRDGSPDTLAGSHPYQASATISFSQHLDSAGFPTIDENPKDIRVDLPPGFVGDATAVPQCKEQQFLAGGEPAHLGITLCPLDAQVGVLTLHNTIGGDLTVPIFNMVDPVGEPAQFGAYVLGGPVFIDANVRRGGDYGVTVSSTDVSGLVSFTGITQTFWGVPADPSHDALRGAFCESGLPSGCRFGGNAAGVPPKPFLTNPTSCAGPQTTTLTTDSWQHPGATNPDGSANLADPNWKTATFVTHDNAGNPVGVEGCSRVPFTPQVTVAPTTDLAAAPTGLDVNIDFHDEGLTNPTGTAQSELKKAVVTLPAGMTINPSAGVGLGACTPTQYAAETVDSSPGAGCPNDSKLGDVSIHTPLLATPVNGSLFIAQPDDPATPTPGAENPFDSLVAIYIVAKDPNTGILIKLAGKVTPDPVTGQLTATFDNNPQLPFDHFNFHFREGQRSPLITPPTCGTYTTQAELTPWSDPTNALTLMPPFAITNGFDGGACPAGGAPFTPQIQSGTQNNNAGSYSTFYLRLTRTDGEQEISGFSTNLPPGLTGNLTGIPFCPEAAIAAARAKTGGEEEANPSCPAASQVGHTLVGTGVGGVLAYVPGKIYLAGPFHGAPFSLVSVTWAKVGPFDLGTVVLRFGLNIDPYTAQVSVSPTTSEPIPHIIQGIVTHVRDIRVYIDRQNFTLNPTSCNPVAIGSTLTANEGGGATITSPFQAASCANLKFAPKFAVSTSGKTSRTKGASLSVKLRYPQGPEGTYANIARVKVDLPKQLPSRLTTLQKACTAAQFNTNPAGCPAASFIGHARAVTPLIPVPLEGPAIFVSHGGEAFPSLIMVLQGYGVTIDFVGTTFISKAGITSSTFKTVPDQPVGSFELTLPEGPFSALAANGNLCASKLAMPTEFLAQNGAVIHQSTPISVSGCKPAIRVVGHSVKGSHASIRVTVPTAGTLVATGTGIKRSVRRVGKAGAVAIGVTLSGHDLHVLAKNPHQRVNVKVKLRFTPKHGAPLTAYVRLLMG
jgi:hypothetical protein